MNTYIPARTAMQHLVDKLVKEEIDKCVNNIRDRFASEIAPIVSNMILDKFAVQEHMDPSRLERSIVIKLP